MEYKRIPINEIELDLNNPRIKQWIEIYGDNITSEGISLALSASGSDGTGSSYSALKESIKVNQGLITPIIVNRESDGKQVVIEGNTRLQIYKEFAESDPNGPWKEIIAIVHDNLSPEEIHAIRLQTHLVGPRDWDPFSKAKYLNQLSNIEHMPMSMIVSYCGGKVNEINRLINAFCDMTQYYFPAAEKLDVDPDPRDFSKFSELQNAVVRETLVSQHFSKEDFAKWVINRNIDTAQNVRKLPAILTNPEAREIFLKKNISEAEKIVNIAPKNNASLESASLDELARTLIQKIKNIKYSEVKELRDNPKKQEEKDNIYYLLDEINGLISDIGE